MYEADEKYVEGHRYKSIKYAMDNSFIYMRGEKCDMPCPEHFTLPCEGYRMRHNIPNKRDHDECPCNWWPPEMAHAHTDDCELCVVTEAEEEDGW